MNEHRDGPNVVIIVLDCVRSSDLPSELADLSNLPNFRALRKESVAFPHAIAPAPWTIPSHAALKGKRELRAARKSESREDAAGSWARGTAAEPSLPC